MSSKDVKEWGDDPSVLFKIAAWLYPVLYVYAVGLIFSPVMSISDVLKTPLQSAFALIAVLLFPSLILFFVIKSRWVLIRIIPMFFFWWLIFHPLTGLTQGALSAAISKAFDSDIKNIQGVKHSPP